MISSLFRKVMTVGLVTSGAVGGLVATSGPAEARVFGCPTHYECVYQHSGLRGESQVISGYVPYADLDSRLHDRVSSWANANRNTYIGIGEWRFGKQYIAQTLPPEWYEASLRSVNFNDKADFVMQV